MSPQAPSTDPRPRPETLRPSVRWSFQAEAGISHLAMARESSRVYAADRAYNLYALGPGGGLTGPQTLPNAPVGLEVSEDGRRVVVLCEGGLVCLFDSDLTPLSVRGAGSDTSAVCVDAFGDRYALCDQAGRGLLVDRYDRRLARFRAGGPLHRMRFCSDGGLVLGLSNRGLLTAFDEAGQPVWERSLNCPTVDFDCNHDAEVLLTASLGRGVTRVDGEGKIVGSYMLDGVVTHVAVTWDGGVFLGANTDGGLYLVDRIGRIQWNRQFEGKPAGVGIDALGRRAVYATDGGAILMLDLFSPHPAPATKAICLPSKAPEPEAGPEPEVVWRVKGVGAPAAGRPIRVAPRAHRVAYTTAEGRVRLVDAAGRLSRRDPRLEPGDRLLMDEGGRYVWLVGTRQARCLDQVTGALCRISLSAVADRPAELAPDGAGLLTAEGPSLASRFGCDGHREWCWPATGTIGAIAAGPGGQTLVLDVGGYGRLLDADGLVCGEPIEAPDGPVRAAPVGDRFLLVSGKGRVRVVDADGRCADAGSIGFKAREVRAVGGLLFILGAKATVVLDGAGGVVDRGPAVESNGDVFVHGQLGPGAVECLADGLACRSIGGRRHWLWPGRAGLEAAACSDEGSAVLCADGQHLWRLKPPV